MSHKRSKSAPQAPLAATDRDLDDLGPGHAEPHVTAENGGPQTARGRKPARQGRSEPSYPVGYGRPPKHTQFKPGLSGNPKGRAPKSVNLATIVKQVLGEQMPIRTGGRVRRMSKIEALFRSLLARAFKGDLKALHGLLAMMNKAGYAEEADKFAGLPTTTDYQAIIADFLTRRVSDDPSPAENGREDST